MAITRFAANGRCVSYAVLEITSVPYYELLNNNPEKALENNQSFFTILTSGLLRSAEKDTTAFELLFLSLPITNQTYSGQVKMYFIIRKMSMDKRESERYVDDTAEHICAEIQRQHFSVRQLSEEEVISFRKSAAPVGSGHCAAIAKRDRVITTAPGNPPIYFNNAIVPTENRNISLITNFMTDYPGSAVSIQLIPTDFNEQERSSLLQTNSVISYYIGEIRRMRGLMPLDANIQSLSDAFQYYMAALGETNAYCCILVFAQQSSLVNLCNKVISTIEDENKSQSVSLEIVDIVENKVSLAEDFEISPWKNSNIIVCGERNHEFWSSPLSPRHLMRLRCLMTLNEIKTVFKLPIDDGKTIGLESTRILANRERFDPNVIAEDNFKVGIIQGNSSNQMNASHVGIPLKDFTQHTLVVGMPGSGKTNFMLGFLIQLWDKFNVPFLAVEPTKCEYRTLIDAIDGLQIFTPGKSNVSPFIINPFIPPKNVTVESYIPSLMTAFRAAFSMPNPLPDIFLASINECYNEYGWSTNSTSDDPYVEPFGMYEFIKSFKRHISNLNYKGDVKSNMESAGVVRLMSLIEQNSLIYDSIHTIPIEDLLSRPTVIELNAINNKSQKSLIMALLITLICTYTKNNASSVGILKNVFLIDEAHVILGSSGGNEEGAADSSKSMTESLEDMIAEIRAFGTGIVIGDQAPSKVGKGIVANTNVKIVFKLVEKDNKDMISNATNMSDLDYDHLGKLGVGEAILNFGRLDEPINIRTYDVRKVAAIRSSITDEEIASLSHYWDDKQKMLIPHRECRYCCDCTEDCDLKVRAQSEFIASGVMMNLRPTVNNKEDLSVQLPRIESYIKEFLKEKPQIKPSRRLYNCTKIKILRKLLIDKSIDLKKTTYEAILKHRNYLRRQ